tara:strand:+ start:4424 stop:5197 length:774 start_codon:yes stop_codon:yes gene_type:complete
MRLKVPFITVALALLSSTVFSQQDTSTYANDLSADLLLAMQMGQSYNDFKTALEGLSHEAISSQLQTDAQKNAFWINVYNAYAQIRLKEEPQTYRNRNKYLKTKFVHIGGEDLSLNAIKHRILRQQQSVIGHGYIPHLFKKKYANEWQVDSLDPRIHFALNSGAASAPPVSFYEPETIDQELNEAQKAFLTSESTVNDSAQTVTVPATLSWFRGDFGGKDDILALLKQLNVIPNTNYRLHFRKYDWTMEPKNYKEEE